MALVIQECGVDAIDRYTCIPARFTVTSMLRVEEACAGVRGHTLVEVPVVPSYVKDYDAGEDGGVACWAERFDLTDWGFLLALDDEVLVGGAAVAIGTSGVAPIEERPDQAVLWDLRVHPDWRRSRIGTRLFDRAADFARARGCSRLVIETQDTNTGACRLYEHKGCRLARIDPQAIPPTPDPIIIASKS